MKNTHKTNHGETLATLALAVGYLVMAGVGFYAASLPGTLLERLVATGIYVVALKGAIQLSISAFRYEASRGSEVGDV
ncbi:hypothetical protein [Actinobaculum massiliense]|uniref:hypothetical protein n=1 Tax=Actinobaculum massiliense TaxID=202789 RepID=UPI00071AF7D2|nr:hypothetical protein [Actinobaculum massiliense]